MPSHDLINLSIDQLIDREGGFVNDPADKGGATKFGVTKATLERYRGRKVSVQEVRDLSHEEARNIIRRFYIIEPRIDGIDDQHLFSMALDWLYHSTSGGSGSLLPIKVLQECVNAQGYKLATDGRMGPRTLATINGQAGTIRKWELYDSYLDSRLLFLARVTQNRPANIKFLYGWLSRVIKFRKNP